MVGVTPSAIDLAMVTVVPLNSYLRYEWAVVNPNHNVVMFTKFGLPISTPLGK